MNRANEPASGMGSTILAFVPNGATRDNRVVREAESLSNAGYNVTLCGIVTTEFGGINAITPGGVPVRRVQWRATTYLKMAIAVLLVGVVTLLAFAVTVLSIYFSTWFPITSRFADYAIPRLVVDDSGYAFLNSILRSLSDITQAILSNPHAFALLLIPVFLLPVLWLVWNVLKRLVRYTFRKLLAGSIGSQFISYYRISDRYSEQENQRRDLGLVARILVDLSGAPSLLIQLLTNYFSTQTRVKEMIKVGMEIGPDIVHCHEVATLPVGVELKRQLGCKLIYEAHEIYDDLASASSTLRANHKRVHESCLRFVDEMITVNPYIGKYYLDVYTEVADVAIVPNSVYPKSADYDGRLHELAQIPPNSKILLYQGGLSPFRGLECLVNAAFDLPENWYVVIMGWGTLEEGLKEQAAELVKESAYKYTQKKMREFLAKEDTSVEPEPLMVGDIRQSQSTEVGSPQYTGDAEPTRIELADILNFKALQDYETESSTKLSPEARLEKFGALFEQISRSSKRIQKMELELHISKKVETEVLKALSSQEFERVRFIPPAPHDELVEYTSGATVGIIPYENAGLNHWFCSPNKIWEYPNAQVPILASRLAYLHHMISTYGIGWTLSSELGKSEIVEFIRNLDEEDLKEKRRNCRAFINQDNYEVHERVLLDVFERVKTTVSA